MWWKFLKKDEEQTPKQPSLSKADSAELRESGRAPLSEIAKKVKEIEIFTRKKSGARLSGAYKSRFKGQGMQFSDFRLYQYGDDVRHIDWRTSARHNDVFVKTFEEERELSILLAVDVSASTHFGSQLSSKRELAALGLASILFSALANNDRVGLLLFAQEVIRYVPPKKGKKHAMRILDELLGHKNKSKGTSFDKAMQVIQGLLKQESVIVFASDFFAEIDKKRWNILARKHDLVALKIEDPRDTEVPPIGLVYLEDPETQERVLVNTSSRWFKEQYPRLSKKQNQELEELLNKSGASQLKLNTAEDPIHALRAFFQGRRRRK